MCSTPNEPCRLLPPSPPLVALLWLAIGTMGCTSEGTEGIAWTETDVGGPTGTSSGDDEGSGETGALDDDSSDTGTPEEPDEPPGEPPPEVPARYRGGSIHSPITPFVAARMREIAQLEPGHADDVFMKAGASSTVSTNTLHCFVDDPVELGDHAHLRPTLEHFTHGDAAGSTPFDRHTQAAQVGEPIGWAMEGNPAPIDIEAELLSPRVALLHFGANDMGWGATRGDALVNFHGVMMEMVDGLIDRGIVPILFGVTRRGDNASAQVWVGTWNATLRAIAQSRQVPFVDLYEAIDPLAGHGLSEDGLHLEAYSGGACVLDPSGLRHGYNVRNLVALEVLDRATAVLVDERPGLDPPHVALDGHGTSDEPWLIDGLPFTDVRNTATDGATIVDEYPGCDDSDESGPEVWYRLVLDRTTRIRAAVLDTDGVDIDVQLVDETATGDGCLARGHHFVETTLDPGTYHFALDTWVSDGTPLAGEFRFVLVECDADDESCDT